MEESAVRLLKKVIRTLSAAILWLLAINTIGIYLGWMFFYGRPTIGNYIFYAFMLISFVMLIRYYIKLWKEYMQPGNEL